MSEEWRDHAACWDSDPEPFFNHHKFRQALQTCDTCTVAAECLAYARKLDQTSQSVTGVWGGRIFHQSRKRSRP